MNTKNNLTCNITVVFLYNGCSRVSVSRAIKPFAEPGRPPDWFSQKVLGKHAVKQSNDMKTMEKLTQKF